MELGLLLLALVAAATALPITSDVPKKTLGDTDITDQTIHNVIMAPSLSCKHLRQEGFTKSGLYGITTNTKDFNVFCDMGLKEGGWTVIMRRVDGSIGFDKTWASYVAGFGNALHGNYFLGLEKIRDITDSGHYELWIGLQNHEVSFRPSDFERDFKVAHYSHFKIGSAASQYELSISGYNTATSTAGDSLSSHNGAEFSTVDRDNDGNADKSCSKTHGNSGWWFKKGECFDANLHGIWKSKSQINGKDTNGIVWESFGGDTYSLKTVVMAIRPVD